MAELCRPIPIWSTSPCRGQEAEASRPLLELKLDARIVYLSARDNPVYRDQARALGAYGYV